LRAAEGGVQYVNVKGIHHVVVHVHPTVGNDRERVVPGGAKASDSRPHNLVRRQVLQDVVTRQDGFPLRRAQIREDEPVALLDRIPRLARRISMASSVWFAWLIQASALDIKQPTVIAASDSSGFHSPVKQ